VSFSRPCEANFLLTSCKVDLFSYRVLKSLVPDDRVEDCSSSPGCATKKSSDLNGSPDPDPWRGGPPTFKNPEKLDPTFQIVTLRSSNEAVARRRPSGENDNAETG
jgi:hypothetical protein